MTISKIYCAIHPLYTRIILSSGYTPEEVTDQEYWEYKKMIERQEAFYRKVIAGPTSILIMIPAELNLYSGLEPDNAPRLFTSINSERLKRAQEVHLNEIIELKKKLGERMLVIADRKVSLLIDHIRDELTHELQLRDDTLQLIKYYFPFEVAENAELIAFGEFEDICVKAFVENIREILKIKDERYHRPSELSLHTRPFY